MDAARWILCPACGGKTRTQIRSDTVFENFLLFCPKCKGTFLISVRGGETKYLHQPDAKTQSEPESAHSASILRADGEEERTYGEAACPAAACGVGAAGAGRGALGAAGAVALRGPVVGRRYRVRCRRGTALFGR